MVHTTDDFLLFKTDEEKTKIRSALTNKQLKLDNLTIEDLINTLSCAKNNLNEELRIVLNYKIDPYNVNIYTSIIEAKNNHIDNLINLYNNSNTYNKIKFKDNIINFSTITTIEKIKLEIEGFDYSIPLEFNLIFYTYDGEIIKKEILPYDYDGLYNEYFVIDEKNQSIFPVANKNNIYIYSCTYNNNRFEIGNELTELKKNVDYSFDFNGYLIFDKDRIHHKEILVKYQPNKNSFELNINKRCKKIELEVINDKLNIQDKFTKELVLFDV